MIFKFILGIIAIVSVYVLSNYKLSYALTFAAGWILSNLLTPYKTARR